jgi:hypothetical protein
MGYVNKGDRIANSYSIIQRMWKWTKKYFFDLLDLTVLNSYIILPSCSSKIDHRKFHLALVQNMLEISAKEPHPHSTPREKPNPQARQLTCLEAQHTAFARCRIIRCHVCPAKYK